MKKTNAFQCMMHVFAFLSLLSIRVSFAEMALPVGLLPPIEGAATAPEQTEPKEKEDDIPKNLTRSSASLPDAPPTQVTANTEAPFSLLPPVKEENASQQNSNQGIIPLEGFSSLLTIAKPAPSHPPLLSAMNPPPLFQQRVMASEAVQTTQPIAPSVILPPMTPIIAGATLVPEPPPAKPEPAAVTQKIAIPKTVPTKAMPGVPDLSIILSNNQFFPSKIILKEGEQARLLFTTVNKKPAALVIERLQIQRWIAKENEQTSASELERSKWEVNRELSSSKITEIVLDPKRGTYGFHDAITGASGEIEVQ